MKELSLNILDIAKNSVKAGASLIEILLTESDEKLTICIKDNGCGMTAQTVKNVTNPFYTTRTTRKVGMGLPLFKLEAEMTGGNMTVESYHKDEYPDTHGTVVTADFYKNHIDFIPLGDVVASVATLIQGSPDIDFLYKHTMPNGEVLLDTRQIREVLGSDIPLNSIEIIQWITDSLNGEYGALNQ